MNIVQLHNDNDIPFGFDAEDWLADANEEEIEHLGPKLVEAITGSVCGVWCAGTH